MAGDLRDFKQEIQIQSNNSSTFHFEKQFGTDDFNVATMALSADFKLEQTYCYGIENL